MQRMGSVLLLLLLLFSLYCVRGEKLLEDEPVVQLNLLAQFNFSVSRITVPSTYTYITVLPTEEISSKYQGRIFGFNINDLFLLLFV